MLRNILFVITIVTVFITRLNAQSPVYEIYAVKFGERKHRVPITDIAVGAPAGDSVTVCFMYWVLKGNNKTILVDAGFSDDNEINPDYFIYTRPDKVLEKLSIKPEEITDIIVTHPHWDHVGGIDLFPNAVAWIQKEDYYYFTTTAWQKDGNKMGFNKSDVLKVIRQNLDGRLRLIQGDGVEIIPGITVFTGSKHTYESQFVLVDPGSGEEKIIIASDNAWFYYNLTSGLPIPLGHDKNAYAKNLTRMKQMVKNTDYIIPGHDPLVFSKFPAITDGIVKIK